MTEISDSELQQAETRAGQAEEIYLWAQRVRDYQAAILRYDAMAQKRRAQLWESLELARKELDRAIRELQ